LKGKGVIFFTGTGSQVFQERTSDSPDRGWWGGSKKGNANFKGQREKGVCPGGGEIGQPDGNREG